jgi:branched-subunit amino acid aminotransferase/4-amino-4-deoxychorismate lyase
MTIYIDGQWYSREDAKVSVFDHGLLYGDGVFEGIRVYSRRIFRLDGHAQALPVGVPWRSIPLPSNRWRKSCVKGSDAITARTATSAWS